MVSGDLSFERTISLIEAQPLWTTLAPLAPLSESNSGFEAIPAPCAPIPSSFLRLGVGWRTPCGPRFWADCSLAAGYAAHVQGHLRPQPKSTVLDL